MPVAMQLLGAREAAVAADDDEAVERELLTGRG